jgi:hypothetical protein
MVVKDPLFAQPLDRFGIALAPISCSRDFAPRKLWHPSYLFGQIAAKTCSIKLLSLARSLWNTRSTHFMLRNEGLT